MTVNGKVRADNALPRHKYIELDGLRGVAALSVLFLHTGATFFGPSTYAVWQRHAFLAVDFFLLLSGFVVSYAYEERLKQPGNRLAFMRDRVIRLYPLLVLGAVAGAYSQRLAYPALSISTASLYAITGSIPVPIVGFGFAFPANFPSWSLFWELLLNVAFAFVAPYLTTRRLLILTGTVMLMMIAVGLYHHDLDMGARPKGVIEAGPRMTVSFLLGVALLRLHRTGFLTGGGRRWWCAPAMLLCFFALPRWSGFGLVYELAAVLIVFPLILLAAAGSKPVVPSIARISGEVSYPLYILQIPLAAILEWAVRELKIPLGVPLGLVVCCIVLPLLSYLAFRLYDEPIRAVLRRRYGSTKHRETPSSSLGVGAKTDTDTYAPYSE